MVDAVMQLKEKRKGGISRADGMIAKCTNIEYTGSPLQKCLDDSLHSMTVVHYLPYTWKEPFVHDQGIVHEHCV